MRRPALALLACAFLAALVPPAAALPASLLATDPAGDVQAAAEGAGGAPVPAERYQSFDWLALEAAVAADELVLDLRVVSLAEPNEGRVAEGSVLAVRFLAGGQPFTVGVQRALPLAETGEKVSATLWRGAVIDTTDPGTSLDFRMDKPGGNYTVTVPRRLLAPRLAEAALVLDGWWATSESNALHGAQGIAGLVGSAVGQDPGQALRVTDRIPDAGNLTGSLAFQEAQAAQEVGDEFLPAPVQEPSLQTDRDAPLAGWPAILLPLAAAWAARRRQG